MINIGRTTIYGNPVRLTQKCPVCGQRHHRPIDTAVCFRMYLSSRISLESREKQWSEEIARRAGVPIEEDFLSSLKSLKGNTLYCPGCGVDIPGCHGRVLEEFAK